MNENVKKVISVDKNSFRNNFMHLKDNGYRT